MMPYLYFSLELNGFFLEKSLSLFHFLGQRSISDRCIIGVNYEILFFIIIYVAFY